MAENIALLIAIVFLVVLFGGEPDIHDGIVAALMEQCPTGKGIGK